MLTGMDHRDMRCRNRATAVQHLIRAGKLSRTQLAKRLNFTQAALTKIANQLLQSGLVMEEPAGPSGRGRPRTHLMLNGEWGHVITVSLTYNLALGVVNAAGQLLHWERLGGSDTDFYHGTYRDQFDWLVPSAVAKLLRAWQDRKLLGIGVISAGYVDHNGIILENDDLPRLNLDMRRVLAPVTDLPVCTDQEIRLLAQSKLWQQDNPRWRYVVATDPGIRGNGGEQVLVIEGQPYYGKDAMAGMAGYLLTAPYDVETGCDLNKEIEQVGGPDVYLKRVLACDSAVAEVFRKVVQNHGYRLAQIVNFYNPDAVLFYSLYAPLGDSFLSQVREAARCHTPNRSIEGVELLFGGRRSDEERLAAAAVPVLGRVYSDGIHKS